MSSSDVSIVNDDSPRDIQRTLERLGAGLKKRWGQNFLIDRSARQRILEALELERLPAERPLWEIGPGLGAMTALVLERSDRRVVAFELDHAFVRFLEKRLGAAYPTRFTVVAGDACDTVPERYAVEAPAAVLGNLPYSSAGRIIGLLLTVSGSGLDCRRMVFTTQRELTDRLVADPGTPEYSAFTVLCRIRADMRRVQNLPGGCFYPAPRVNSSVVLLTPRYRERSVADLGVLQELLRGVFSSRRKTLRNCLAATRFAAVLGRDRVEALLRAAGGTPEQRPQQLEPEIYRRLANELAAALAE